jgi:hypothetical protein
MRKSVGRKGAEMAEREGGRREEERRGEKRREEGKVSLE